MTNLTTVYFLIIISFVIVATLLRCVIYRKIFSGDLPGELFIKYQGFLKVLSEGDLLEKCRS